MKLYFQLLAISLAVIFTACSPAPSTAGNGSPPSSPQQEATSPASPAVNEAAAINTLDSSEAPPPPPEANPFVRLVEEDLANQLEISTDQINFLKLSDMDWQDLRQGCSDSPGKILTKGRVTGYQIWLEANGKNYLYHIGLDHSIFLCPGSSQ